MADSAPTGDEPSWSVEFGLELQGDRDLAEGPERAFTARIAEDAAVRRVTETEKPAAGSIRVTAVVTARTRAEAEARSEEILQAARSAAGTEIPDWPTTSWWSSSGVGDRLA